MPFPAPLDDSARSDSTSPDDCSKCEHFFRRLVDSSLDIITLVDEHGFIRFENRACQRLLGYAPAERIGRWVFDFVHPDDTAPNSPAARSISSTTNMTTGRSSCSGPCPSWTTIRPTRWPPGSSRLNAKSIPRCCNCSPRGEFTPKVGGCEFRRPNTSTKRKRARVSFSHEGSTHALALRAGMGRKPRLAAVIAKRPPRCAPASWPRAFARSR